MGKTTPRLIDTAERRHFVIRLRKTGMTYQQISEATIARFGADGLPEGWDSRYAYKDVMRVLQGLNDEIREDGEELRELELMRLDRLFLAMYGQAIEGNQGAVDRCLRIMERRARLLGLDKPEEHTLSTPDGGPLIREVIIERDAKASDGD